MRKTYESDFGEEIVKVYTLDDTETVPQILKALNNSELRDRRLYVRENVDGEMKSIEGYYYIEKLAKIDTYEYLMSQALFPEDVYIRITGIYYDEKVHISLHPYNKTLTMSVQNGENSLEFSDLFKTDERRLESMRREIKK
jgi:hypothetical protein